MDARSGTHQDAAGGRSASGWLRWSLPSVVSSLVRLSVMFSPAGIGWVKGWVLLLVFVAQSVAASVYLWRTNPESFAARSKFHAGTKGWDKVIAAFLLP